MSNLKPVNGQVILRPIEEEEQMSGNIVLPDIGHENPDVGEVVAVSPVFNFNTGEYVEPVVETGMKVIIPRMGAQRVTINQEEYWIVQQPQILAILEEK
jgi:co-chaperonin GroES (HSP10)